MYQQSGQLDAALRVHQEVLHKRQAKLPADNLDVLVGKMRIGGAYRDAGQLEKAVPVLEETLHQMKAKLPPDHPRTIACLDGLALAYHQSQCHDKALALWRELLSIQSKSPPVDRAVTLTNLGRCLLKLDRAAEAEPLLREALRIEEQVQPDGWATFHTKALLGATLLGQRKYSAAEPLLVQGMKGLQEREAKIPFPSKFVLTQTLTALVRLYEACGKPTEAAQWRQRMLAARPDSAGSGALPVRIPDPR
jgi:tetratricopeptide (TPR) repeat protein